MVESDVSHVTVAGSSGMLCGPVPDVTLIPVHEANSQGRPPVAPPPPPTKGNHETSADPPAAVVVETGDRATTIPASFSTSRVATNDPDAPVPSSTAFTDLGVITAVAGTVYDSGTPATPAARIVVSATAAATRPRRSPRTPDRASPGSPRAGRSCRSRLPRSKARSPCAATGRG